MIDRDYIADSRINEHPISEVAERALNFEPASRDYRKVARVLIARDLQPIVAIALASGCTFVVFRCVSYSDTSERLNHSLGKRM